MGPTGSDVGRGTAAGYVNMQTKTPHLPRAGSATLTYRDRQSAARHARRQPAALRRRARQLDRQVGGPVERAVAGQRRRRPGRSARTRPRRSRRRSASASARRPASSHRRRCCASDNLPDYGIPGAAWQESPLAPTTVHARQPGRSEQLLRQPGVRLRPRRPEHGHWRALEHNLAAALGGVQPDPLQQDRARGGHQHGADRSRRTCRRPSW